MKLTIGGSGGIRSEEFAWFWPVVVLSWNLKLYRHLAGASLILLAGALLKSAPCIPILLSGMPPRAFRQASPQGVVFLSVDGGRD
jgi:hypothetical protein